MRRGTVTGNARRKHLLEQRDFDYILEEYDAPDFYEMTVSIGGDVCRFRYYGNATDGFSIYEK